MPTDYRSGVRIILKILLGQGRSVIPLYRMDPAKGLQFVGSSVYIKQDNIELLFTARHVVEPVWPERLWYPYSPTESRVLPCEGFHTTQEKSDDFCIAELNSSLPAWSPFAYGDIDAFSSHKEYQHLLIGFPGSLAKRSSGGVEKLKLMGYLTSPAPESEYRRLNVDPSKQIVVLFRKGKVYDHNQQYTNFPNPNGMSGGGVFQFNENIPQLVSLVGIMTDWDTNRKNAIIATRFEEIKRHFSLRKIV